jgi:tetratricopeptide (TPR) repeat protein
VIRRTILLPPAAVLAAVLAAVPAPPASAQQTPAPPPAPEDPCAAGPAAYRAGEFAESRLLFLECLEQGGEDLDILLPLAVMGVREGRLAEAVEFAERAVTLEPESAEARYWYGRALLREGRTEEARRQWEQGLQLDLGHLGILEGLSRLALNQGETAKAYQLLTQLQRQGIDEPWLDRLLAEIAAGKGLWAQALGHTERAIAAGEPTLQDYLTAAELSILAGRKPQAVDYGRQAVALEPGSSSYGGLGEAFFAVDEMDSALVYLRLAVEQDPTDGRFRFNLANALEITGNWEEAGTHFEAYLEQNPRDPVGHFNYGIHLDKSGRHEEGRAAVGRAIALDPSMLTARVVMAQMLENAGQWDAALAEVALLKERDPANAAELDAWSDRILAARDAALGEGVEGRLHILHMVLASQEAVDRVQEELAAGEDFASLAVRYSQGAAAVKGGDIGWIDPDDLVEPMKGAITPLDINEISPPLEAGGLFHIFKRIP